MGGQEFVREVYDRSYRLLVAQMYGICGDLGEAEDAVQEAFVRAVAAGRRFRVVDNPEAWLRTVAINVQRSRWKRLRNWHTARHRLAPREADAAMPEDRLAVVAALRGLSQRQREALVLFYIADLSVAEVAQTLRVPEGTVKARLSRGRQALARLLEQQEEGHRV
jgi:RNA polymerase sigma-70 factor, ECF subfamily